MIKKILGAALVAGLVAASVSIATTVSASCTPYTTTVVSDGTTVTVGGVSTDVLVPVGAWTASIPGASWIWANPADAGTEMFDKTFTFPGAVTSATLDIAVDNTYSVTLNGNAVGSDLTEFNFTLAGQDSYSVSAASFIGGTNTLKVTANNLTLIGGDGDAVEAPYSTNPAGVLFKLVVESEVCVSNDTVINNNDATVTNVVLSSANTGGNWAGGSYGGRGGRGGDIANDGGVQDVNDVDTGNGGNGGDAGLGGEVNSGNATANATLTNTVNDNDTNIDRCSCTGGGHGGDVTVRNGNVARVGNVLGALADTGDNEADGSYGGEGGQGGDVYNGGGNQNVSGNEEEPSTTGNGGNGGKSSDGGLVTTGNSASNASSTNVVNRNVTRIKR
ncbi:MAG: hypothetical protein G01um101448_458 [Parcubacteria group bacterium Gr01-1014_48]|nr:MAG: hypothetical protein Greene041614_280 [Parcubacteria group bacterium Greene0416_14]TSC73910.1 MAG: hypothetical protein G01um101448_458 [Parcubacteria group bacterium Gr01-1014_48]TSD00311.1 MAG: hypothetical protein Greene101415_902 [Parcubacteria group bacterium Greene1014_15]TSD07920.1 MAG: hypothetical protein Greene07144_595 [Parcubacteria group bacterium Greene0714_4]